jgi:hypothetical protein
VRVDALDGEASDEPVIHCQPMRWTPRKPIAESGPEASALRTERSIAV